MSAFQSLLRPILTTYPEVTSDDLQLVAPPKLDVGDLALRIFPAAKKLGVPPPKLAEAIAATVDFGPEVRSVTASGPYVNFTLDRALFARTIVETVRNEADRFGSNGSGNGKKLLIEHTSINPNASPHVGRARNAMYGDCLSRLFAFEGYEVDVHYYVNDIGRQIGLLALYCDDLSSMTFDDILDAYVEANAKAETDPEFAKEGYDLLAKMERGDTAAKETFQEIVNLCLDGQLKVLHRLGLHYDHFDYESTYLNDARLDAVVQALEEKGAVFTDEDERLVVDLSKIGHERDEGRYFVLRRANGSSLYGFRDLAYTMDKMEQGADLNLWVLGEDHKLYAEQQRLILAAAGKPAPEPIYYAYILLKDGKMSTRQGNVVLLSDFLDEAASRASEKVNQQCADLDAEERRSISEKVAVAAVKFAILRVNPNKNVIFEWESSLSFTGDTGPYVQYSCARIHSILRKFGEVPDAMSQEFPTETDAEWALLLKINAFRETVAAAATQRNVSPIAQFALDTARLFTTFYHDCPVLNAESEAQTVARVQLCSATLQTLTNALQLLGVEALERM
ncbi:MAG: arginine--tRNA ligase [Candidatus Hydrogenedentes bacterium]|nr:arginine--tRNA ligase [Candidatus Hydrogenedentota bacterium]